MILFLTFNVLIYFNIEILQLKVKNTIFIQVIQLKLVILIKK